MMILRRFSLSVSSKVIKIEFLSVGGHKYDDFKKILTVSVSSKVIKIEFLSIGIRNVTILRR